MKNTIVCNRYAKAVLQLAVENKAEDVLQKDFSMLQQILNANRDLVLVYKSPVIKEDKKIAITQQLFKNLFHPISLSFLEIVIKKGRSDLIQGIAQQFSEEYKKYKDIVTAEVITAIPPDDTLLEKIKQKIKAITQKENLEINVHVNPDIIGGIILRVGDFQWDLSIKSRIYKLEKEFSKNPYIKNF